MNDHDQPTARPPYWGRFEDMGYAELRSFLEGVAENPSGMAGADGRDHPHSPKDFQALCDLLKAKAAEPDEHEPTPEEPVYEGPPHPGPFTPSDELEALYRERRQAEKRVEAATRDGASEKYLDYIRGELDEVEREIDPVERREGVDYNRRLREYDKEREPFLRRMRARQAEAARAGTRPDARARRVQAVERLRRRIERALDSRRPSDPQPTGRVPFEILPPGEATTDRVRGYYDGLRREGKLRGFDQDRLEKVLALPWNEWRPGTAGMEGYSAYGFPHTQKVLLECPAYPNATYVLDSGEDRLLGMNKQQLQASDEARRIFHTGPWEDRVKKALGIA